MHTTSSPKYIYVQNGTGVGFSPQPPFEPPQHRHNRCSRTHMADQRHIRDDGHFSNIYDDLHLDSSPSDTLQRPASTEKRIGGNDGEMSVFTSSRYVSVQLSNVAKWTLQII